MQQRRSLRQQNLHAKGWSLDLLAEHEHRNVQSDMSNLVGAYIPSAAELMVSCTNQLLFNISATVTSPSCIVARFA